METSLYHLYLHPQSRAVRIMLGEAGVNCQLILEKPWARRPEFMAINPIGMVPVLRHEGLNICGYVAIREYINELMPDIQILGKSPYIRCEVRRICEWFDIKCTNEVINGIIEQKVYKKFLGLGTPDSRIIMNAIENLKIHLSYCEYLLLRQNCLAGTQLTAADYTAAAFFSALDYVGSVDWAKYPETKNWYSRIKSRPSFRPLLDEYIPSLPPPSHYSNLDF